MCKFMCKFLSQIWFFRPIFESYCIKYKTQKHRINTGFLSIFSIYAVIYIRADNGNRTVY